MTADPLRLLQDPATAAVLRRDLDVASRVPDGGVPYDVDAGAARFETSLAARLSPGTGAGAGVSGGLAVGALLLAGGLAALLGWQLAGPMSPPASDERIAGAVAVPVRAAAPAPAPELAAGSEAPEAAPEEEPSDLVAPASGPAQELAQLEAPAAKQPRARKPRARPDAAAQPSDPLREARELNAARSHLGGDPARAFKLAQAGASTYRGGTFVQEWEGVAVLALFELGRVDEARTRGEQFLRRYPSGTYAPKIRKAIAAAP